MSFSQPLTQDILRQLAGKTLVGGYVSGANGTGLFLGLSTGYPGETGENLFEPSDAGNESYSRIFVATTGWTDPSEAQASEIENVATQNFAAATGTNGWDTIYYLTAHSALTAGTYLGGGSINGGGGITIDEGDVASFASGAAKITLL